MNSKLSPICFLFCLCALFTSHDVSAQKSKPVPTGPDSVVFGFKAGPQFWRVPEGITAIHISIAGAQGGSPKAGKGGRVQCDMNVTAATKLVIYIGSQPAKTEGGENGGGKGCGTGTGGGGASDVRIGGTNVAARKIVAGGGGGCGYGGVCGAGGGLTGGNGSNANEAAHIAYGGTQTAGGAGARAYFSGSGTLAIGGDGVGSNGKCANGAMGGGGGGYYGGGGSGASGGGGGSSYADAALFTNVTHEQGVNEGNGKVVISWVR